MPAGKLHPLCCGVFILSLKVLPVVHSPIEWWPTIGGCPTILPGYVCVCASRPGHQANRNYCRQKIKVHFFCNFGRFWTPTPSSTTSQPKRSKTKIIFCESAHQKEVARQNYDKYWPLCCSFPSIKAGLKTVKF